MATMEKKDPERNRNADKKSKRRGHRGGGVGRALLGYAEAWAKAQGKRALRLDVHEINTPAIKLYESCGFRYIATVDLGYGAYGLKWFRLYEKLL